MSDVSADLRIFPDKEMFSVDMAEVLDAAILKDGVIQGCTITIVNGVLNITAGRIVIKGRLGVITAGTVPIPAISTQQTCSVVAVCDLRTSENPFYISIVDAEGLQTLNSAKSAGDGFNVEGTLDYVVLGTVTVNPVTGMVSNWSPVSAVATPHKGKDVFAELMDFVTLKTANPGIYTDGIVEDSNETSLKKIGKVVECKIRFRTASDLLTANKTLYMMPAGFRPAKTIRPIVHDWNMTGVYRFNLFNTGEFQTVDVLPNNKTFIMTFVYMTP